ncbi:MAG TPA: alpha/beta hydrolase, partial [Mycobacterium sp.]|nr:alpha/beta hydrolase [Mycobacterium sp.]
MSEPVHHGDPEETVIRRGSVDVGGGITLAYEDLGDIDQPPVVLIMGFASQLTAWPVELCRMIAGDGFRVIRFDNRDIGLSSKLDGMRVEGSTLVRMARYWLGLPSVAPYTLGDMASDTVGLLDALGLESAHIVGASMGGMIAQIIAAEYPERVRSLGIMFSTTAQRFLRPPRLKALRALTDSPGKNPTRDQVISAVVESIKVVASPKYPEPEHTVRQRIAAAYDRNYCPAGVLRQFAAGTSSGSMVRYARRITAPTVVLHGMADPLMPLAAGKALARNITG